MTAVLIRLYFPWFLATGSAETSIEEQPEEITIETALLDGDEIRYLKLVEKTGFELDQVIVAVHTNDWSKDFGYEVMRYNWYVFILDDDGKHIDTHYGSASKGYTEVEKVNLVSLFADAWPV